MTPAHPKWRYEARRSSSPSFGEEIEDPPARVEKDKYRCVEIPAFGQCPADVQPPRYRRGYCLVHPEKPVGTCGCEPVKTQKHSQARAWDIMRTRYLEAQETMRVMESQRVASTESRAEQRAQMTRTMSAPTGAEEQSRGVVTAYERIKKILLSDKATMLKKSRRLSMF